MFNLLEVYFDVVYLLLMFGFGLRLLPEKGKNAKLLAAMALLLALGDSCHLLPRVYAHLSPAGLSGNSVYLSYGQMITGLTMSVFYVIFFHYYRSLGGKNSKARTSLLYMLFAHRVLFVLLPANNWGGESPYYMAILRNVPFLIMGIVLTVWTYQERHLKGLNRISYLIAGSFFFYSLVVLCSPFMPAFGALMLPKTICYLFFIYTLYKHESGNFQRGHLLKFSITGLELGLLLGVFYRECTKLFNYQLRSTLALAHPHMLILGFLFSFVLYLLFTVEKLDVTIIKKSYAFYMIGLCWLVASFVLRGIYQIAGQGHVLYSESMLAGLAGVGHIILGVGLMSIVLSVHKKLQTA